MNTGVIPGLRDTPTHRLALLVYRRHADLGNGMCLRCGHGAPCPAQRHAVAVLLAAGVGTRRGIARPAANPAPTEDGSRTATLTYCGYAIDGRGRRLDPRGFQYTRDVQ